MVREGPVRVDCPAPLAAWDPKYKCSSGQDPGLHRALEGLRAANSHILADDDAARRRPEALRHRASARRPHNPRQPTFADNGHYDKRKGQGCYTLAPMARSAALSG